MKTLHDLIVKTDFPKWVIWSLGMLAFTAGLIAMAVFDALYLEYPLTLLLVPLLIFYYFKLWGREKS